MTTKGEWIEYTGNDEQIAEMWDASEKGFIVKGNDWQSATHEEFDYLFTEFED